MTLKELLAALNCLAAEYGLDEVVHINGQGPVTEVDPGDSEGYITIYGGSDDD